MAITAVTFRPIGTAERLWECATASEDSTLCLWDLLLRHCRLRLDGPNSHIQDMVYSPDGAEIVAASLDGTIRRWDTKTGECISMETSGTE